MEEFFAFAGFVIAIFWGLRVKLFRDKEKRISDALYLVGMIILIFGASASLSLFFETYAKYSKTSYYLKQNPDSIISYFDFIQWRYAKVIFVAGFVGSIVCGFFFIALTKLIGSLDEISKSLKENIRKTG